MRSWMNLAVLHGWVHKTDESSWAGRALMGGSHWPTGSIGSSNGRDHLDGNNTFANYQQLAGTFRHEVAHIYGYGRASAGDSDSVADSVATACSP
jgi:hypothetical protein